MAPKISPIPKPSKKCLPKYDIQQFQTNAPQPPDGSIPAQLKIQGQASSLPPRPHHSFRRKAGTQPDVLFKAR